MGLKSKVLLIMFLSSIGFAQMRPLPANTVQMVSLFTDTNYYDLLSIYEVELSRQRIEIDSIRNKYSLEKKIAGITGLILFASGNESLKNIGLVGIFCYSIW